MNFRPYGPFEIPLIKRRLDKTRLTEFWTRVNERQPGLSEGIGCYVFAIRAGGGVRPWYVGKTDRLGFKSEVFQPSKQVTYEDVLSTVKKGTAVLYFIARHTPTRGVLMKKSTNKNHTNGKLEELLIGSALARNPDLANKHITKHFKMQVPGYMNETAGRRSREAGALARLLGTTKR